MEKQVLEKILMDLTVEGVHVIDANGITLLYNDTMAKLEGLVTEEVLDKSLLEVLPNLEGKSTLIKVLATGEPILDNIQTYFNKSGKQISTINSTWPIKKGDKILGAVEVAREVTKISEMAKKVIEPITNIKKMMHIHENEGVKYNFDDILGNSLEILNVKNMAEIASKSTSNVLIIGESGTGKELFAQSIHGASNRKNKPFVAENCAAIPESLLEGLLFGTAKGGFTGALDRHGLYQQAHGGTLLLDEVTAMPMELQAKLLRAIQEGKIRPIGSSSEVQVDVRIIGIINEDPLDAIQEGRLRKDLFFRLSVINIYIPPLRERKEDIDLLTNYFIDKFSKKNNKKVAGLDKNVESFFKNYDWPGNVRELEHVIEGAINLTSNGEEIKERSLPYYLKRYSSYTEEKVCNEDSKDVTIKLEEIKGKYIDLDKYLGAIEDSLIRGALKIHDGNITKAAKNLGISRQRLQHKLKKRFLKEYMDEI